MPALLGLFTVALVLILITGRLASPLVALIAVPVAASLAGGFGLKTSTFIVKGVEAISPVAGMFIFAILYFGIMTDAGMIDPLVNGILRLVGNRPSRITLGTALLALLIHLDGSGAVTFLITIPIMLPLYERLGMDRRVLACTASLAAGVNFLPWTGPTLRASAALHVPVTALFNPLIPVQICGLVYVFAVAWILGAREEKRLGWTPSSASNFVHRQALAADQLARRRPGRTWWNILITIALMSILITGLLQPVAVFMVGVVIALVVNYPGSEAQKARIDAHASAALMMAGILFAAGAFTGILRESGMLNAMAQGFVSLIPPSAARHIPVILGFISMPLSLVFDPDSFYFGVLPVIASAARILGVSDIQVAQSALLGQMTTGFPVSPLTPATFLIVGLAKIDLGTHQRFTFPFLFGASAIMTVVSLVLGILPW